MVDSGRLPPSLGQSSLLTFPATYHRFNPYVYLDLETLGGPAIQLDQDPSKADDAYLMRRHEPHMFDRMYRNNDHLQRQAIDNAFKKPINAEELKLTEDQLILCSHQVRGYSLKIKKWRM